MPIRESLRLVSDWGAQGVQLDVRDEIPLASFSDSAVRDLKHLLSELELSLASTCLPLKHPLYEPAQREGRLEFVQKAMRFSARLGAQTMTIPVGRIPAADHPDRTLLFDMVSDLARLADHVGVTLALSPCQDAPAELAAFAQSIIAGTVGLDFDPAQLSMTGHDPATTFRESYLLAKHIQVRDGWRDRDGGSQEMPFGEGSVDWVELFALIAESEYSGWCTLLRRQGGQISRDLEVGLLRVKRLLLMA